MKDFQALLTAALGLTPPWQVVRVDLSEADNQLDVYIDFPQGSTFPCPDCGREGATVYDSKVKTWRHLNFWQYRTYLHVRVPRVNCAHGCNIKQVKTPWARPGSGFTLFFEALVMHLAKEMPVKAIADLAGENDTRIWRVLHHHVDQARENIDFSQVQKIGVDETSAKRGHNYISLFMDLETSKLLFATEGKNKETVAAFAEDLTQHNGDTAAVKNVCCDLSPAFISGVKEHLPEAEIIFDRFHIMKIVNDAVDEVRRDECRENEILKKTRFLWLKNPDKLTAKQRKRLESLKNENLDTSRAYNIKLALQKFFDQPDRATGEEYLKRWYFWATHSKLVPIVNAAYTIKDHWDGILNWFNARVTNGILEGTNSLIQAAKARARGFRNVKNMITISYIIASGLEYALPSLPR